MIQGFKNWKNVKKVLEWEYKEQNELGPSKWRTQFHVTNCVVKSCDLGLLNDDNR